MCHSQILVVYLKEFFPKACLFPIPFFDSARKAWTDIRGKGLVSRLALVTLFLLLFIGYSLGKTRISHFMPDRTTPMTLDL